MKEFSFSAKPLTILYQAKSIESRREPGSQYFFPTGKTRRLRNIRCEMKPVVICFVAVPVAYAGNMTVRGVAAVMGRSTGSRRHP